MGYGGCQCANDHWGGHDLNVAQFGSSMNSEVAVWILVYVRDAQ